jgi:hypothetical protein
MLRFSIPKENSPREDERYARGSKAEHLSKPATSVRKLWKVEPINAWENHARTIQNQNLKLSNDESSLTPAHKVELPDLS